MIYDIYITEYVLLKPFFYQEGGVGNIPDDQPHHQLKDANRREYIEHRSTHDDAAAVSLQRNTPCWTVYPHL